MQSLSVSPSEAKYLAIDPGDTFGWAKADAEGNLLGFGQESEHNFVKWTDEHLTSDLDLVICEDYVLYQKKAKAQSGSRMKTSKQIGKLELLCEMRGVKFELQHAQYYPIGAMWGGFKIPTNHSISHQWVAAAHLIYNLTRKGIRQLGQGLNLNG
jgi:hypothetical protein